MPTLFIPAPIRDLTQGKASVVVSASSVREAIESLEVEYPGVKERLCDGEKIRPNISVMVNGHVSNLKLREKLTHDSEVHFVIAISGG
jgi:molybdopterin converting factor small subunit